MALMSKVKFEELMNAMNTAFTSIRAQRTALNNATIALHTAYEFYVDGISPTDDPDVELPMLQSAYDVDTLFLDGVTEANVFGLYSPLRAFVNAFETHLRRMVDENFTDATIDGYAIYRDLGNAMLVIVDDIWNTLKTQRLQARTVGKTSQVTMFTRTGTYVSPTSTTWADTAGALLYAEDYYDPYMTSNWENFKGVPLTLTKDKAGNLNLTSLKITGLDETGILVEKDYGNVTLSGTTPLALDVANKFVSVVGVTFTATLAETTVFTVKNVATT